MRGKFSFPLVIHLSALFGLLMAVTVGLLTWIGYERAVELISTNGSEIAEKSANEIRHAINATFAPVELAVSLISDHQVNDETTWQGRMRHFALFARALDVAAPVNAYYVGYRNGDFFMVRRLRSAAERKRFAAGPQTAYIVQSIDWEGSGVDGRAIHLDSAGNALRHIDLPDYPASYDPRQRPWYARAQMTDEVVRTDPYIFTTTGEVGLTFSKQSPLSGTVVGADLGLGSLSEVAGRQKPTPGSRVVLIDKFGWVIAADGAEGLVEAGGRGWLGVAHVESFASPPVQVFSRLGGEAGRLQHFEAAGGAYLGIRFPVQLRSGDPLGLIITIPQGELLAAAYGIRRDMLLLSALVSALALAATLFAAYSISRSLARLTRAADRFQRFDFAKPLRTRTRISEVRKLVGSFHSLQDSLRRYRHLLDLISRERDLTSLQPAILQELSAVLEVEKAVLYVVPQQADGLVVAAHKDGARIGLVEVSRSAPDPVPALVGEALATGDRQVVAGAVTAEEVRLPGIAAVAPPEAGFACALCYPLRDRRDQPMGAILFLDAGKAGDGARALVGALTGIAAVSLETRQLIASEKLLFNAFITLIASAIDAKSPYTGGHCARVPELTKMLAEAAVAATEGPFRDFALDEDEWGAVHVASWLHDCGKVTSPEFVVDKATKLETIYDRIHEVRMRFEVLKRDAEIARLEAVLAGADAAAARAARDAEWRQLDDDFAFVARCNEGGEFLGEDKIARLRVIATRTWERTLDDTLGISQEERARRASSPTHLLPAAEPLLADRPDHIVRRRESEIMPADNPWGFKLKQPEHLYNRGELHNLTVSRGTLSEEERYKINDHIIQTIIMLSALPYPRHLRSVPELAGGHHEKMDGTGYPRRLTKDEMSPVARMMAVADIFEALTASDRPYKKAKTLSESLRIMAMMARDGHIDPDIFELFLTSGIYRAYAERYMAPEMIDDVSIGDYLASQAA